MSRNPRWLPVGGWCLGWGLVLLAWVAARGEDAPPAPRLVTPSAVPAASLRYPLLPPVVDRRPGNAALHYHRALAQEQQAADARSAEDQVTGWLKSPLAEFPRKEVTTLVNSRSGVLDELRRGARRDHCDWEIPIREQFVFFITLPELQPLRKLARMVVLAARLDLVEGRFDAALDKLQTAFALARHVSTGGTLIHGLVGISIATQATAVLEEWGTQPAAPNLYWSLTALPRPLVDLRPGLEVEMYALDLSWPELRSLDTLPKDPAAWDRWIARLDATFDSLGAGGSSPMGWRLLIATYAARGLTTARERLMAEGYKPEQLDKLPPPAIVVVAALGQFRELRDRVFRELHLPYPEARPRLVEAQRHLQTVGKQEEILPFASLLIPALVNVASTQVRIQRQIDALRVVEALRAHAQSQGSFPAGLDELRALPIPLDPTTGQAFNYRREATHAVLESPSTDDAKPSDALRWELQLAPSSKPAAKP